MSFQEKTKSIGYIPSFDGVRGLFCLVMILHHMPLNYVRLSFSFVWILLQAFFVMSGFLITKILLANKTDTTIGVFLKNFYAKRAFRIFPLYFAYVGFWIVLVCFFGDNKFLNTPNINIAPDIKQNWWMLLTYTYNFKELAHFSAGQSFFEAPIFSHLWSLCVEEHFYLFFPFLVYFLSEKNLLRFVLVFIVSIFFIRIGFFEYLLSLNSNPLWAGIALYRNTISQMDGLMIGALLALINWNNFKSPKYYFYSILFLFTIITFINGYIVSVKEGISVLEALHEFIILTKNHSYAILMPMANFVSFFFMMTLMKSPTWMNKIFENKAALWLGKISYGIYIYHYIVFLIVIIISGAFVKKLHLDITSIWLNILIAAICLGSTVIVAKISYELFEVRFLKLKKYFQTPRQ
jgi:peptidoglycan/LPS O-acetylase OafA/YrhL